MNLSPVWVRYLEDEGIDAVHWSEVGNSGAEDVVIMDWARANACVVFTHDLDFSALLATSAARGPSVVQVRAQDVLPGAIGREIVSVLREHGEALGAGAIVSVDAATARVRILPIHARLR